jgi:hypothetical protein
MRGKIVLMIVLRAAPQWAHLQLLHPLFLQHWLLVGCRRLCRLNHLPAGPQPMFRELLRRLHLQRRRQPLGSRRIMSMTPSGTLQQAPRHLTAHPPRNRQQGMKNCTHHHRQERLHHRPCLPRKSGPLHHRHHIVRRHPLPLPREVHHGNL